MTKLHLAPGLSLPLDFATKTAAILAQRRKGKTYAASVIAEEMVAAKQPFVAMDPTGAWWGLRSSADGEKPGLPVVILGGQHADLPLERTGGGLVADLVVEEPGYYVIDFSLFESGEAERQFAVDFAERLYRAKGQPGRDFPLHMFVDEADRFIPQIIRKGSNDTSPRLLGAFEAIVRRGGLRGLGTTLISQRAAIVNKNVLEMIDVLIALRTVGPNDRKAIEGYVKAHGTDTERDELLGSLASLAIGEAWVWEPGAEPPLFKRVQIRERRTFNSSATPKAGERRVEPRRLADVEIEKYKARMASTIERAKADDPKELRKEVAVLRTQLTKVQKEKGRPIIEHVKQVDQAAIDRKIADAFAGFSRDMRRRDREQGAALQGVRATLTRVGSRLENAVHAVGAAGTDLDVAIARLLDAPVPTAVATNGHSPVTVRDSVRPRETVHDTVNKTERLNRIASGPGDASLPKGERSILTAAAQYPHGATREQLTILTGYKRSTRDAYVQRLSEKGFVAVSSGGPVLATDAGVEALGSDFEPLPTGGALREYWLARLPEGERRILEPLLEAYPDAVDRDALTEATEYKRSTRDAYVQRLGTRRLVTTDRGGVRAADLLFD